MHPKLKQDMTKMVVFCSCDCLYASQPVNLNAATCIGRPLVKWVTKINYSYFST